MTLNLSLPGYPLTLHLHGSQHQWRATDRPTLSTRFQLSNQRAGNQVGEWKGWRFSVDRDDGFVQALQLSGPGDAPPVPC